MRISGFELVDLLQSLPKEGLLELRLRSESLWIDTADAEFSPIGESGIRIDGRTGFGNITMASKSSAVIDIEAIDYFRHSVEPRR